MRLFNDRRWLIGIVGSVLGFILGQTVSYWTFRENLETTKKIERIRLGRELNQNFYHGDAIFRAIRISLGKCEKISKETGGKYDDEDISNYLGFFDDIGFYYREGFLELDHINQFFGQPIIEAYENSEFLEYIKAVQMNERPKVAFTEFQKLARELEELPGMESVIDDARSPCSNSKTKSP